MNESAVMCSKSLCVEGRILVKCSMKPSYWGYKKRRKWIINSKMHCKLVLRQNVNRTWRSVFGQQTGDIWAGCTWIITQHRRGVSYPSTFGIGYMRQSKRRSFDSSPIDARPHLLKKKHISRFTITSVLLLVLPFLIKKEKKIRREEINLIDACMVRTFPINDDGSGAFPAHLGFWPGNSTGGGEVIPSFFSSKLPVVCRQTHRGHPFGAFRGENPMNYPFSTFLLDIVLVILFIKVVCFLLRPLRQPRIVCEIIGGMMIGPSMLGQSRSFNYFVFPQTANYLIANLGVIGFMLFLFITGVQTDVAAVLKSPRKHMYIASICVFIPFVSVLAVGISMRSQMHPNMAKMSSVGGISAGLAFTSFPVIYTVLRDMNLLNSEVGKLAMSVALLGDMAGIVVLIFFEAMMQLDAGGSNALIWYLISVAILAAFMLTFVRRAMDWVIAKTPEGKLVDQSYVVIILLAVFVTSFLTDMFGLSIAVGPIWLGLLVPHGPPLGATLAARSETFILEFFMPFSFAAVGLNTNVYLLDSETWPQQLLPLFSMTIVSLITKFVSTTAAALFFKVPARDSLTLGLMMNLRGQIDILLYLHWIDKRILGLPGFTMMTLHTLAITGVFTPLISLLYDPTRPYRSSKRRTIQHTPQSSEIGLVLAVSDHETLTGLTTLLDFAYPTITSPFSIFAVQLVELFGRATPLFIDHEQDREDEEEDEEEEDDQRGRSGRLDQVQNVLRLYKENREECVKVRAYTAHAPKRLMFQDICELALSKQTAFILLPYQIERLEDVAPTELRDRGMLSVNVDVLAHAPCSVCIYYDKGRLRNPLVRSSVDQRPIFTPNRFVVLFLGGADNREALHLADRMTANPEITLTVIRFLSYNHEGEDEREKKLDDGVVTWFWVKNEANDRVSYKEVVVKNGAETLAAIQAMNVNDYDLWITGRKEGINPKILEGLSTWSEDHQLGVIGDTVAGSVFASEGSVLVVQQQVRNQKGGDAFLNLRFDYNTLRSLWSSNNN